jgi:hypothetical protein
MLYLVVTIILPMEIHVQSVSIKMYHRDVFYHCSSFYVVFMWQGSLEMCDATQNVTYALALYWRTSWK